MSTTRRRMPDALGLLEPLLRLHDEGRDRVLASTARQRFDELASVTREEAGDTIYAIDAVSEEVIGGFAETLGRQHSFVLVAEGLPGGQQVFPRGTDEAVATWRIIVDPIDGTRGLMYQKRSAWILTGVAENCGPETTLQDITFAVAGRAVTVHRYTRLTRDRAPIRLAPSTARTIAHGYATVSRFFPGAREE